MKWRGPILSGIRLKSLRTDCRWPNLALQPLLPLCAPPITDILQSECTDLLTLPRTSSTSCFMFLCLNNFPPFPRNKSLLILPDPPLRMQPHLESLLWFLRQKEFVPCSSLCLCSLAQYNFCTILKSMPNYFVTVYKGPFSIRMWLFKDSNYVWRQTI